MNESIVSTEPLETTIYIIRGQRVMLDQDLAVLYEVSTTRLNEQMQRNIDRFPEDFAFRLTKQEWTNLISQFATSSFWGGRRKLPYVFTEHGAVMLASVLRSKRAIHMSVEVVRAFIRMRKLLNSHEMLSKDVRELKSFVLKHSNKTDREFQRMWQAIEKLSAPPPQPKEERRIGFCLD